MKIIPIHQPGNTYLGAAGQVKPTTSYVVSNVNKSGGYDVDYSITFRITEACDLRCSYCHWYGGRHYEYNDIIASIDRLFEFFVKQNFKAVVFYYHGGEATRHPRIRDVLKHVHDQGKRTNIAAYNEMQTNLTASTERIEEILPYCDQMNVTFHYLELIRRPYKLDAFKRNWNILINSNKPIHNFDVMLEYVPDDKLQEFYNYIEEFLTYPNIVNSEMVYRFGYNFAYNKETEIQHAQFYATHNKTEQYYTIDGVKYTTNDLFKVGLDCMDWWCGAGQESITINGDGNVFNCGIQMTNYVRKFPETVYTNLVTDPIAVTKMSLLYKLGTRCRWDYCGGDFYLSKEKR